MISEKTVELNLTTELINYAWKKTNRTHFALAPSQRMESVLGYDTQVIANGFGVFIQYKRAYVSGSNWQWHLNRTTLKDQHRRLQDLENQGNAVYYALPYFHLPQDVEHYRRRLLLRTFWFRPNQINPVGGPTGYHDVYFDSARGTWQVSSDKEKDIPSPEDFDHVFDTLSNEKHSIRKLMFDFNAIVLGDGELRGNGSSSYDDLVESNFALVRI